ncbi:MAG: ECF-type sigma factor [Planctomycetota bacterium]
MPEAPDPVDRSTRGASSTTLVVLLYDELRQLAAARLRGAPAGQTLQPTALVHEAFLRLQQRGQGAWDGRRHFFGAAARAMHDILVERARARSRQKRGGGAAQVDVDAVADSIAIAEPDVDVLALSEALEQLAREDERKHELVLLRYFAGLEHQQIAELLGVSLRTVERDWRFARAWLKAAMTQP